MHRQVLFPKTHSITDLLALLQRSGLEVPEHIRQAHRLTSYALLTRYPGLAEGVSEEDYLQAVELAGRVYGWAASLIAAEPKPAESS